MMAKTSLDGGREQARNSIGARHKKNIYPPSRHSDSRYRCGDPRS